MTDTQQNKSTDASFLSGGEMGRLIREFDWSKTSLGPRSGWSEALKNTVSIALANRFPMLIWWGEDYIQLYNDAYIPVLGLKHPNFGLGHPGSACWDEIWDVLSPLVDTPFNGGPATWMDDILLKINRNNRIEETHFLIAYSAVPDSTTESGIGGVLATVNEITDEIIGKRQMETLRKLGKAISTTLSEDQVYAQVTMAFKENALDIPFAVIHRLNADQSEATLAATAGIEKDHPVLKSLSRWKSFEKTIREKSIVVSDFETDGTSLPVGEWDVQPRSYLHVPVRAGKNKTPVAIITLALNPYREYDDLYSNFIELIADQVAFGVSNARAFEEEQKRAEALSEIDKAKTTFFGNISHEFRTPLTLMLGPINDLLVKDSSSMIVADRETILLVQRNALRLQKLVNSLLDFSRIEAGKYKAKFRALDISRITADLASNFTSLMKQADLTYEVDCPILPEPAYLDPEMWEKIVLNLISNAFKFTIEGKISVKTRLVGNHFEMSVSDTGVGISKENLAHLFERFHRVENVRSRTHEGSGIGLALVNELVKMHGGNISVESAEDQGTTFTVSIPVGNKHLPAEQLKRSGETFSSTAVKPQTFRDEVSRWLTNEINSSQGVVAPAADSKPLVLLAEDNVDMQLYIKSILEEYCRVHVVGNGRQALERVKITKPDLILSDVMMPEVDGIGLVKALRKDEALQTIPIILLSARAGEEARIEGLQSGADDYLTKPFGRNELIARVSSNLHLSKLRREALQALRYSEAQLRALVNATSDVIYRMSADWKIMRHLDGRNFLQDTGLPLTNWEEKYIHPTDRTRVWIAIQQAIKSKSMFQLEHQVIRADGTTGWTFSRAIPIFNDNAEIIEWFGVASDISARKFYETELEARVEDRTKALNKANSELQVSNEDLQQFAHVASHDLKEPLRKIKTFTLRLREEFDGALPENGKTYIEKVLSAAQRMSTMIDGVLTYSSLNAEGLETETIDLNTIIRNIEIDLELVILQKRATIVCSDLPLITGGRVLLHQLFYNLLNNSLKFSHPDRPPFIEIRSRRVKGADGDTDIISVSDNGIGFDQEQSERIFETFTRLHSKDRFDGTGLGLALCKKIVERYKGNIKAFGKRDIGATFVIELPVPKS
jgi:signal transduction histidine kinase/CheY-like chemotaxis protein